MKVLNIEVDEIVVERFSEDNFVSLIVETTNGSYDANVYITGVSDIKFWNESYGVSGSPVWVESNVHSVVDYFLANVYDEYGDGVTNPETLRVIEEAVYNYDFTEVNETIAEEVLNEIKKSYD